MEHETANKCVGCTGRPFCLICRFCVLARTFNFGIPVEKIRFYRYGPRHGSHKPHHFWMGLPEMCF